MATKMYTGLPGRGKTANSTHLAVIEYNRDNTLFVYIVHSLKYAINKNNKHVSQFNDARLKTKLQMSIKYFYKYFVIDFIECFNRFKHDPINNIFTNYPVLLDVKKNIYSNIFKPDDLKMKYQFPKGSSIFWDETQRDAESREFKSFNKKMGTFFQHHRHADIKNIILVTQHPKRVDNKLRDLCESFRKYRIFFKIPFIPYIFAYYTNYYEPDDYGRYNHSSPEFRNYDYDNHMQILSVRKSFDRYDSKYFRVIFEALPTIPKQQFKSKELTLEEIEAIGVSD